MNSSIVKKVVLILIIILISSLSFAEEIKVPVKGTTLAVLDSEQVVEVLSTEEIESNLELESLGDLNETINDTLDEFSNVTGENQTPDLNMTPDYNLTVDFNNTINESNTTEINITEINISEENITEEINTTEENQTLELPPEENLTAPEATFVSTSIAYIYSGNDRIAKLENDQLNFYHSDYLRSAMMITDESGATIWAADYYPYGGSLHEEGLQNTFSYTGKELDQPTELFYYGARYYDPELGRFTQVDPKLRDETNNYGIAENNPVRFIDPNGEYSLDPQRFTSMEKLRETVGIALWSMPSLKKMIGTENDRKPPTIVFDPTKVASNPYHSGTLAETDFRSQSIIIGMLGPHGVREIAHEATHWQQFKEGHLWGVTPELYNKFSEVHIKGTDANKGGVDLTKLQNTQSSEDLQVLANIAATEVEAAENSLAAVQGGKRWAEQNDRSKLIEYGQAVGDAEYDLQAYKDTLESIQSIAPFVGPPSP